MAGGVGCCDDGDWTPDFLLIGDSIVAVEVKPIEWLNDDECDGVVRCRDDLAKVRASKRENILVLGAYPPPSRRVPDDWPTPAIGVLVNNWGWGQGETVIANMFAGHSYPFDVASCMGDYAFLMGGEYDGDYHLKKPITHATINALWREAGNRVQWKPR